MERTVLMIRPEQRTKLTQLAKREHVSTAEINRRAIDAYDPDMSANSELEMLAEVVIQSNQQAMKNLQEARNVVKEALSYFEQKRKL